MDEKTLRKKIRIATFKYTFKEGNGGILILAGTIACIYLLFVSGVPILAIPTILVCLLAGYLVYQDYLKNPDLKAVIVKRIMSDKYSTESYIGNRYGKQLGLALEYCEEIIIKIMVLGCGKTNVESQIIKDIFVMLELQQKSALQAIGLHDVHNMVKRNHDVEKKSKLHEDNVESIKEAITETEDAINDINEKLETLLLQIVQIQKNSGDMDYIKRFSGEASKITKRVEGAARIQRKTKEYLNQLYNQKI